MWRIFRNLIYRFRTCVTSVTHRLGIDLINYPSGTRTGGRRSTVLINVNIFVLKIFFQNFFPKFFFQNFFTKSLFQNFIFKIFFQNFFSKFYFQNFFSKFYFQIFFPKFFFFKTFFSTFSFQKIFFVHFSFDFVSPRVLPSMPPRLQSLNGFFVYLCVILKLL